MKKNTNVVSDFLYRLLNAGILSGVVILCFSDFLGISDVTWKHVIVLLLSIVLFSFVKGLNKKLQIYVWLLGILLLISLFISVGREKFLLFVQRVLYLPFGKDEGIIEGRIYAELILIFLAAIIICFLQLLLEKYFFLKAISALAVGGWLLYALFGKQQVHKAGVAFAILYGVLIIIEWVQNASQKTKSENSRYFILWLMPFLILYIGLLSLTPAPDVPYSWQWAKDIYQSAEEKMTMYMENLVNGKKEDLDGAVSGFSEESGLFSNVRTDSKQLMKIKVRNGKNLSLYLTGKVYDSFDGHEWNSLNQGNGQERLFDVLETVYALERYAENSSGYDYKKIYMEVKYQFFHTGYLLAPSKTWEAEGKDRKMKYHQEGANLVFDSKEGYGTEYLAGFCQLSMDQEKTCDFLQCDLKEEETVWKETVKEYAKENIELEELDAYRENIRAQYLKQMEISPEVEKWLADITAAAETDVEKLYCIEDALAGMGYNTNPGKLPETVTDAYSFLNYFLLEKREGYCVHFATAFVLLAQAEGFPARYVQGFCIPVGNEKETAVSSGMAHAWPEVYIEGKGWIPFEPTPGYGAKRYVTEAKNTDEKIFLLNLEEQAIGEELFPKEEAVNKFPEKHAANREKQNIWISYAGKFVLLIFVTGILAFAVNWFNEKNREKRRTLSEKYRIAVLQNLQILDMLGYKREQSETYHELAERIRYDAAEQEVPTAFIETYESALYGTLETSKQELEACFRQKERLLEILKKSKGKKYLLCRVRLYIIRHR